MSDFEVELKITELIQIWLKEVIVNSNRNNGIFKVVFLTDL